MELIGLYVVRFKETSANDKYPLLLLTLFNGLNSFHIYQSETSVTEAAGN